MYVCWLAVFLSPVSVEKKQRLLVAWDKTERDRERGISGGQKRREREAEKERQRDENKKQYMCKICTHNARSLAHGTQTSCTNIKQYTGLNVFY